MEYLKDKLIKKGNYYLLDKEMVKQLGVRDAMFLTHLIDIQPKLTCDSANNFYQYSYQFEGALKIKQRTQYRIANKLVEMGLIFTKVKRKQGTDNKRTKYFILNNGNIAKQFNIDYTEGFIKQAILNKGEYWVVIKNLTKRVGVNPALYFTLAMETETMTGAPMSDIYISVE